MNHVHACSRDGILILVSLDRPFTKILWYGRVCFSAYTYLISSYRTWRIILRFTSYGGGGGGGGVGACGFAMLSKFLRSALLQQLNNNNNCNSVRILVTCGERVSYIDIHCERKWIIFDT